MVKRVDMRHQLQLTAHQITTIGNIFMKSLCRWEIHVHEEQGAVQYAVPMEYLRRKPFIHVHVSAPIHWFNTTCT